MTLLIEDTNRVRTLTLNRNSLNIAEFSPDGRYIAAYSPEAGVFIFDAQTGAGINPDDCRLAEYPVKIEDEDVLVNTEGITPLFAHI